MALVTKNFSDIITFTRASTATYFNSAGVLTSAATNAPRFDYNPSTLAAQGLLIEESRTNSIRNNTMVGAVAGTPGTLPTNWNVSNLGTLTQQVVGTGTSNGITYIDLRFSGTTSSTQLSIRPELSGTGAIVAANGQTWAMSLWSAIVAGGLTNITGSGYGTLAYDAAGAFIGAPFSSGVVTTSSTLTRTQVSGTIAIAGTAFIQPQIYLFFNSGVAIDITLRIGLPQLELGAFATSVIPTTTTALTRAADVASVNTLSPWFNASAGTTYFEGVTFDSLAAAFPRAFQFNDSTNNNVIQITRNNSSGNARMSVVAGGVAQAAADATAWTLNATTKAALAYATNDFAIVANGGLATTDTSGTVPTVSNLLLGSQALGASFINGYLRRITYYPRRLSNAELQAITV
jgi:hypothetical protein